MTSSSWWCGEHLRGDRLGLLAAISILAVGACNPLTELPSERVCEEVGYAIANRTLACTGDTTLANDRYDLFEAEYACRAGENADEPVQSFYTCPGSIRKIPCEQVTVWGDDLDKWLQVDPVCGEFLTHNDGRPIVYVDAGTNGEGGDQ